MGLFDKIKRRHRIIDVTDSNGERRLMYGDLNIEQQRLYDDYISCDENVRGILIASKLVNSIALPLIERGDATVIVDIISKEGGFYFAVKRK